MPLLLDIPVLILFCMLLLFTIIALPNPQAKPKRTRSNDMGPITEQQPNRVLTTAYSCQHAIRDRSTTDSQPQVSQTTPRRPCSTRLASSHNDRPFDVDEFVKEAPSKDETVLYLAYGSNLCKETFRGKRGIKPLSQINVQVPELRLTFDLPGIPYVEPCFANSAKRDPEKDAAGAERRCAKDEKSPLLEDSSRRQDNWHKGMIGVVYEVTAADYAHIIATEGGGSSYKDILVDCFPLPTASPWDPVPSNPETKPFKAHTLFAPAIPPGEEPPKDGGRFQRPDTEYAQASARYLKLITDGAAECSLPYEYQDYLQALQPYTPTTAKQRLGQFVFLTVWGPLIFFVIFGGKMFTGKDGQSPAWLKEFTGALFKAVWASYDGFFKPLFGDGERTIDDNEGMKVPTARRRGRTLLRKRCLMDVEHATEKSDR